MQPPQTTESQGRQNWQRINILNENENLIMAFAAFNL
jgi:hypothetical protein